jgi:signal transduction histidine kinase
MSESEGGPLSGAQLSELRHNLRTPINQILGYAEMLIEDAADAGHPPVVEALRRVHSAARATLGHINQALGNTESLTQSEAAALAASAQPHVDAMLASLDDVRAQSPPDAWREDLGRLSGAARLVQHMLSAPAETPRETEASRATAAPRSQPSGPRLLIVDDNAGNRDVLRRRLERQGYAVDEACDGREALEALASGDFDLVLLDIMMPVMDGFEVLARMRADRRLSVVPVVVISALDDMEGIVRAIESGAEDYLFKPFDPVLLRARIGALLEKRRLRNELTVQERLASMGALAAGIAHEIKNPLNFVVNFAEISADLLREQQEKLGALSGSADPEALRTLSEIASDLQDNIARIREHGARADRIVASMLAHSRGQVGEREPVDMNALAREYVNLAFHGLRARDRSFQAAIESDYDPAMGVVDAIPQDLSRAILNIASNAFYAMRAKTAGTPGYPPTLRVTTRGFPDHVELRIRDNGPGIPKEIQPRIFDPFFTTKPAGEGTGLGLSISYDIVAREHGGDLRVESQEGEFTEFIMTLPRSAEARR